MTKPKYEIGQNLFYLEGSHVREEVVTAVAKLFNQGSQKGYQYCFQSASHAEDFDSGEWYWERHVFPTKADLLASL